MSQIEVLDLSLKEPDLSLVVKQIYRGGLREHAAGENVAIVETAPTH